MIYHSYFIELLAEATSGLNHQTEVQAQQWVTAPTCFEVLLADITTVDPMLKTVYARYLAEAWFNTQVNKIIFYFILFYQFILYFFFFFFNNRDQQICIMIQTLGKCLRF